MESLMDRDSTDRLMSDFKRIIDDAEALLKATAHHGGAELAEVREKIEASLKQARRQMRDTQTDLVVKGKEAAIATDAYLRANPWQSVGIAAGAGLLIGLLSRRW